MNPELAELSHTNYAIVTPFRVFFLRFIFWVSRYYLFSCLYNWAGVGARNWAEVCRTLWCALCALSFLILESMEQDVNIFGWKTGKPTLLKALVFMIHDTWVVLFTQPLD